VRGGAPTWSRAAHREPFKRRPRFSSREYGVRKAVAAIRASNLRRRRQVPGGRDVERLGSVHPLVPPMRHAQARTRNMVRSMCVRAQIAPTAWSKSPSTGFHGTGVPFAAIRSSVRAPHHCVHPLRTHRSYSGQGGSMHNTKRFPTTNVDQPTSLSLPLF